MTDTAVLPARFHQLTADEAIPLAHRALWTLLWEGEARLVELLSLDVRDVDLAAHAITLDYPKAGGPGVVPVTEATAGMLCDLIGTRDAGPLFTTDTGQPMSREAAAHRARQAGVSIHGFRLGGQLACSARE